MIYWFYQCLYLVLAPFIFVVLYTRKDTKAWMSHMLGAFQLRDLHSQDLLDDNAKIECHWVHAVSLGETKLAIEWIRHGSENGYLDSHIVFTTTIEDALIYIRSEALELKSPGHIYTCFFPLDFHWIQSAWIQRINPKDCFVMETDFWPSMLHILKKKRIPSYLINGRISKSLCDYSTLVPGFTKSLLSSFQAMLVQYEEDRDRLELMGSTTVLPVGNAKFDLLQPQAMENQFLELKRVCIRPIIIYGSFHPDEWGVIEESYSHFPTGYLHIVVPRNPDQISEFLSQCETLDIDVSVIKDPEEQIPCSGLVLLARTGVLAALYQIASIAVVGGSFNDVGGHNFVEPLLYKKVTIIGPNMRNFLGDALEFSSQGFVFQVENALQVRQLIQKYDSNARDMIEASVKAFQYLSTKRGVIPKSWELVQSCRTSLIA